MTHYTDLSPYSYLPETVQPGVHALNVGWLAPFHRHPKGAVPPAFTEALALLCRDDRRAVTRGFHPCGLWHRPGAAPGKPVRTAVGGVPVTLGTAEVRVAAPDGTLLIAPTLVLHYVTAHRYRPPDAFIDAVMAGRRATG
ncbi:hypothetical protein [Streptomyces sp. RFCAC02]|uniref:DUF7919 family protein n=1 Tax=Streptomyces sp. RFCAC02 TaxID=2499143 RepID=UPI00101F58BC|nr:hypothetical protein [Streptomyces sp. RFCAC02]